MGFAVTVFFFFFGIQEIREPPIILMVGMKHASKDKLALYKMVPITKTPSHLLGGVVCVKAWSL